MRGLFYRLPIQTPRQNRERNNGLQSLGRYEEQRPIQWEFPCFQPGQRSPSTSMHPQRETRFHYPVQNSRILVQFPEVDVEADFSLFPGYGCFEEGVLQGVFILNSRHYICHVPRRPQMDWSICSFCNERVSRARRDSKSDPKSTPWEECMFFPFHVCSTCNALT